MPHRFDAAFAEARRAVAAGELGFLHTVRSTTLDPAPPPDDYVKTSGGIFRDCSVHDFDAVRYVTGQEVVEVYATGSNQGAAIFAENNDVDTAATILTLDSGTLAWCPTPATTHAVTTCVSSCTARRTASPPASSPSGRSTEPGVTFPDGKPHYFFMDRFADAVP